MPRPESIAARLQQVRQQIQTYAQAAQRPPDSVQLLAVSKTRSVEDIRQALHAGCRQFGESYLQEALTKIQALADADICWHFIGPIQANKTRLIAQHFAWVHSVDRLKIATRLHEQRPPQLAPLQVCIQVNITSEQTKSGVAPAQLSELARQIRELSHLRLRGLMTVPRQADSREQQRACFARLREMLLELNTQGYGLDTLSMGMSGDVDLAIQEGATIVRIGSAIFGPRPPRE